MERPSAFKREDPKTANSEIIVIKKAVKKTADDFGRENNIILDYRHI
ncbi:MAG: hypothetical protein FWD78_13230 [Treponema sp.]|nr:hypothetical protein [Treponema sp.]